MNETFLTFLISAFGGLVSGLVMVFFHYYKDRKLKKLDVTYKYVIPATQVIIEKLTDIKIYAHAKSYDQSGCEYEESPERLLKSQNKPMLIHITELREILIKNNTFLSDSVIKNIENLISYCLEFFSSMERSDFSADQIRHHYKDLEVRIDKIVKLIKKDLDLYL